MARRNVVDFKIINLSEEKFQELKEAGQIDPNALYTTPDTTKERLGALETKTTALEENKQDKGDYATNTALSQTNQAVGSLQETKQDKATAVKYSDTEFIAHQAMPSDRYIDLTLGTSSSSYTAPADGWLNLRKIAQNQGQYIELSGRVDAISVAAYDGQGLSVWIPVSKDEIVKTWYNASGTTEKFRFIYANGAQ